MRKLGAMEHDECAPWCNHDPASHVTDCDDSFCDGQRCQPGMNDQCFGSGSNNVRGCRCKVIYAQLDNELHIEEVRRILGLHD